MSQTDVREPASEIPLLTSPRDALPAVVDTPEALQACIDSLAAGHGPTAVDAERAQSFRYTARGYLFQFRRAGSGTHLVDPVAFDTASGLCDLSGLAAAINDDEWIIHAATQDLPCLVEAGLVPDRLFDTELTGRLLGLPRVGLGPLIEGTFQLRLLKEHSAANWSLRPIPQDWLVYAALDVELLVELRDNLLERLKAAGKLEWALQEFDALVTGARTPSPQRPDRWRRTSGTHTVRTPLGLAVVRELWEARDDIARSEDSAPGRILIDQAITDLANLVPRGHGAQVPTRSQLRAIDGFKRRNARRWENNWVDALDRVAALPASALPPLRVTPDGPPNPRTWELKDPEAWARWQRVRPATNELASELELPVENLISPDTLRRIAWRPPANLSPDTVDAALTELGSRPWQRTLLAALLAEILAPEAPTTAG